MRTVAALVFSMVIFVGLGCGGSDDGINNDPGPDDIRGDGGSGGSGEEPFVDVPPIPEPETPGGSVPATSETLTVVEPLVGLYRPNVQRMYATWNNNYRSNLLGDRVFPTEEGWSDEVEPLSVGCLQDGEAFGRVVMVDDEGSQLDPVTGENIKEGFATCTYQYEAVGLQEPVYIRRDRRWELKNLEGGAGAFLLLEGNVEGTLSTTVTMGSSMTETSEFSASVSAGIEVPYVSVSATLTQTFSTSITISEEMAETFEKTVFGEAGKIIQFQVWELVEVYSFTDADGNPIQQDDYEFVEETLTRRGAATFLQATEFDTAAP